jgi:GDP/UDP-N,N'-diacetylbacillosamine 2-epimerase (hydrolysing)
MKKKKILVTTGTRADYGILREILFKIIKNKNFELLLVVTGTHLSKKYGYTLNEIEKDGFKINYKIPLFSKDDTSYSMTQTLGQSILEFGKIHKKFQPDINLILGDRDEMLASAISAYHMNIVNAHISGGDKSGGLDEYTRHAITKMSNIHFAISKKSKIRILKMGENPDFVFYTGSPGMDDLVNKKIGSKLEIQNKFNLDFNKNFILLLQHPVTTRINETEKHIHNILKAIIKSKKQTIAILPNSDAGSNIIHKNLKIYAKKFPFIHIYKNIPRHEYLGLLENTGLLIGNSSSGITEAGFFGTPVINVGIRQKNRDRGSNVLDINGNNSEKIFLLIQKCLKSKKRGIYKNSHIYGRGNSSSKIVQILENIPIDQSLIDKQIMY